MAEVKRIAIQLSALGPTLPPEALKLATETIGEFMSNTEHTVDDFMVIEFTYKDRDGEVATLTPYTIDHPGPAKAAEFGSHQ